MAAFEFLVKIGDQNTQAKGYKQGMLHRCKPAGEEWGKTCRSIFATIRIDGIPDLATARALCQTPEKHLYNRDVLKYRSAKFIDFADIKLLVPDYQFLDLSNRAIQSPVIDVPYKALRAIENYDFHRIFMPGSVTSGSYPVDGVGAGGAGVDYELLSDALADMANLTGNLTFTLTANISDDTSSTVTENIGAHTFTITATGHSGYPGSAKSITAITGFAGDYILDAAENGTTIYENIHFTSTTNNIPQSAYIEFNYISAARTIHVRKNFFEGSRISAGDNTVGVHCADSTGDYRIYNNMLWKFDGRGIYAAVAAYIENNTVFGCDLGINLNNTASTANYNAVFDNGTDWSGVGSATGNRNCSSDATGDDVDFNAGSDNLGSKDSADNFASETDTDTDFLFVKDSSADIYDTGAQSGAPTYATTDTVGTARPQGTHSDIGAHELIVAAGGGLSIPIAMHHYKQMAGS